MSLHGGDKRYPVHFRHIDIAKNDSTHCRASPASASRPFAASTTAIGNCVMASDRVRTVRIVSESSTTMTVYPIRASASASEPVIGDFVVRQDFPHPVGGLARRLPSKISLVNPRRPAARLSFSMLCLRRRLTFPIDRAAIFATATQSVMRSGSTVTAWWFRTHCVRSLRASSTPP